ncbi:phosphotransferase [Streptomyces sp. NPDC051940]|uniref:phosphotransferase n=1 Tax=Streptomyces sp. NPDC051940 TaxID=3155675 RepID=UPI00342486CA
MQQPPDDVSTHDLARTLRERWGLAVAPGDLVHAPVGFGDHHWTTGDGTWFVTVADVAAAGRFAALRQALGSAAALASRGGLEFVVAPAATPEGEVVVRLDERYALALYPYVEGAPGHFGEAVPEAERITLARLLARLHAATPKVTATPTAATAPEPTTPKVTATPPVHEPGLLAHRAALDAALDELDTPWPDGGPFTEPARELLASHGPQAIRAALAGFDEAAARIAATEPVLTHGEPHPGNVLRLTGGRLTLIDWDTLALAPPERDLWLAAGSCAPAIDAYRETSGREVSAEALAFYGLRWLLDDVCVYVAQFRAPHTATADTEAALPYLRRSLEVAVGSTAPATQGSERPGGA